MFLEMSNLWSALRSQKAVFKATDGSIVHSSPNTLSKGKLARAVVLELPTGVVWLHKDISPESSRFLFLREAEFKIASLVFSHYAKGRAGIVVMFAFSSLLSMKSQCLSFYSL